jgi:hypothetical protein
MYACLLHILLSALYITTKILQEIVLSWHVKLSIYLLQSACLFLSFHSWCKIKIRSSVFGWLQHKWYKFVTWFTSICMSFLVAHGVVSYCCLQCRLRLSMGQKRKSLGPLASHIVTRQQTLPWVGDVQARWRCRSSMLILFPIEVKVSWAQLW